MGQEGGGTHAGDLQEVPELSLPLNLHLHHCGVGVLDVLQCFFDPWKQVDNLLFADQDLTVEDGGRGARQQACARHRGLQPRAGPT